MNKKYTTEVMGLWAAILIMGVLTGVVALTNGYDWSSLVLNAVFLGIMTTFCVYCVKGGMAHIHAYTMDLNNMIGSIDSLLLTASDDHDSVVEQILNAGDILKEEEVKERYVQFLADYRNEGRAKCNIADYINYDQLTEKLPMRLCHVLPGTMTALGILGTFIGLITGLSNINLTDPDMLVSSVQVFVSGINVAFFTSAYGIVLSIYLNHFFNEVEERFEEKLILLENKYDYYNVNRNAEDVMSAIYKEEQKQTLNQEKMNVEFGKHLAEALVAHLVPAFDKTNENIQNMLANNQRMQKKELEAMTKIFVAELAKNVQANGEAMQNSVDQMRDGAELMKESTSVLREWQGEMIEQMKIFIGEVRGMSDAMQEISKSMKGREEGYDDGFGQYATSMDALMKKYALNTEALTDVLHAQNKKTEELYDKEEKLLDTLNRVVAAQEATARSWDAATQLYRDNMKMIEDIAATSQEQSEELKKQGLAMDSQSTYIKDSCDLLKTELHNLSSNVDRIIRQWTAEANIDNIKGELDNISIEMAHLDVKLGEMEKELDKQDVDHLGQKEQLLEVKAALFTELDNLAQRLEKSVKDVTLSEKIKRLLRVNKE